jgi:hypothetical protein
MFRDMSIVHLSALVDEAVLPSCAKKSHHFRRSSLVNHEGHGQGCKSLATEINTCLTAGTIAGLYALSMEY